MKYATRALVSLLSSGARTFHVADLYRFELATGQRLLWAGGDTDVQVSYRDVVVNCRPVAYFPLDENAEDETPEHRDGVVGGGASYVTWNLDGSGDKALTGTSAAFDGTQAHYWHLNKTFTYEFWWKRTATGAATQTLLYNGGATGELFHAWQVSTGRLGVRYSNGAPTTYLEMQSATALPIGVWFHVAVTYDGLDLTIYLNGTLDNQLKDVPGPSGYTVTHAHHKDAQFGLCPSADASGSLAHVAVYDYPLSATEIAWHYAAGYGEAVFDAHSTPVDREAISQKAGLEVGELDVTLHPRDTDTLTVIGTTTVPLRTALRNGAFDGAAVTLMRAFGPGKPRLPVITESPPAGSTQEAWSSTVLDVSTVPPRWRPTGAVTLFAGNMARMRVGEVAECTVKSALALLNRDLPRHTFKPGCGWTLFDRGCGLDAGSWRFNGAAAPSSSRTTLYATRTPSKEVGYYTLGQVWMTTGQNAFLRRAVKEHNGAFFVLAEPLPYTPEPGDGFIVYAGCDKTIATCDTKFDNVAHYRGCPFVPEPDTLVGVPLKEV